MLRKNSSAGSSLPLCCTAVSTGAVSALSIGLQVAATADQVTVLGEVPTINTVTAQLQTTVDNAAILRLPVTAAGVLALAGTAPGVTPVPSNNPFLGPGSFSSNGGRGRGNNITIDSANATDVSTTGGAGLRTVPTDAIAEVQLITHQFTAEFGRNASSQFRIVTRGGSNTMHGQMFSYIRTSALSARNYFDRSGRATPNKDNVWGAFAGGAMVKDRLFYFGSYEQNTVRGLGGTRTATVPTPAQAAGASPLARQLMDLYQVPAGAAGTVSVSAPNDTDRLAYSARVDANLTSRDTFYIRLGESSSQQQSTGNTFITSNLATNGASSVDRPWTGTMPETHVHSPRTINTFLASFGRTSPYFTPLAATLGPEIAFADGGTANFGPWSGLPQGRTQNVYQVLDTVTHTVGQHTLKFGAELNRIQLNAIFDSNVRGTVTYLNRSDFLSDRPFQYSQRFGNSARGYRVWNEFFFAQDDFRVSRNLTLSLGYRLEVAHGTREVNNILSNIDPALTSTPLGGAGTGPMGAFTTGGSYFNRNWNSGPRLGFAWTPRGGNTVVRGGYGIAYDFIYQNPITNGQFLPPFMYLLTLPQSGFTATNTLANVLAGTSEFQTSGRATVGTFGTSLRNFGGISPIDQNLRNPQVQQFSLTVERPLARSWVGRVSYSGSKGNYLQRTQPLNFLKPGLFTAPTSLAQQLAAQAAGVYSTLNSGLSGATARPSNRLDGRFNPVNVLNSSANSNYHSLQIGAARRFAGWYGLSAAYTWSKSIDDVSDALGVLAADSPTQQNPFNNRDNRAVSAFDTPHRVVITHQFQSRVRGIGNKFVSRLLDGWFFAGIFQAQAGLPVNIRAGAVGGLADGLLGLSPSTGTSVQRPNLTGPLNLEFSPDSGGTNPNKVTGSGLAAPLVGQFGSFGRNVVRLNPLIQSDMSMGRDFAIKEGILFRLQAQITNVFNNTNFSIGSAAASPPSLLLSSPATFGYYQGTETDSRRILLTGRFIW